MKTTTARVAAGLLLAIAGLAGGAAPAAADQPTLFITSATEVTPDSAKFPLYRGTSRGREVWFIVLDSSDGKEAKRLGVNHSQKLANARNTAAVQQVQVDASGVIAFPATVDFSPVRRVTPGPQGFPPVDPTLPGAVGEEGYSPLIQLPNGVVLNAPHVRNASGQADKVLALDLQKFTVTMALTAGFQGGRAVRYLSTDASDPVVAALENVTFAPALAQAPRTGADGTDSSRAALAAFTNGQTGANNPERQGLRSAILDGLSPLNVLFWNPTQGRYSPLWDVHLAEWTATAVATGRNTRQTDFGEVENLAQHGVLTGPGGAPFAAIGVVVDCPIVIRD
jgi:hypothetical protein